MLSRKKALIVTALVLFLGTVFFYRSFQKDFGMPARPTPTVIPTPTAQVQDLKMPTLALTPADTPMAEGEVTKKVVNTERVICNNEAYIFDNVVITIGPGAYDYSYFTEIYRGASTATNFLARLKSPRGGALGTFQVLTAPQEDCDRIYLTTSVQETDAPLSRIFAWRIGTKEVTELSISKAFTSNYVPRPLGQKAWVSSDGEKILVSQPEECNFRVLQLLKLREDKSIILVQLAIEETFGGSSTEIGYCTADAQFGWLDASTIYYDVYDATATMPRPVKERRTLKI